jgi:hypothetical protein
MRHSCTITLVAVLMIVCGSSREASAALKGRAARHAPTVQPWHGDYYDAAWGVPVAVVVSPRAKTQTNWGWGVGGTTVTPIQAQFQPDYPGSAPAPRPQFQPTPRWPSNTQQFGDYYIRGPR